MGDSTPKQDAYSHHLFKWAKLCGQITEDFCRGILGFIPNGLEIIYDKTLKRLPLFGKFFARRWVEQVLKLCTGITIGQGISADIGRFIFRPLGFMVGTVAALIFVRRIHKLPNYQGQIMKAFHNFSGFTVAGALIGLGSLMLVKEAFHFPSWTQVSSISILTFTVLGALIGLIAKLMVSIITFMVNNANAANAWKNMQRAKELNGILSEAAKQKAKSRILRQAQDIIQQMNGPQSQQHLEEFFTLDYDAIAANTYKKIERHFNYLTDRVCHGDVKALKRLESLNQACNQSDVSKNSFEAMLDRIFNARAIFKLKDDVDTAYDRWHYQFLQKKAS